MECWHNAAAKRLMGYLSFCVINRVLLCSVDRIVCFNYHPFGVKLLSCLVFFAAFAFPLRFLSVLCVKNILNTFVSFVNILRVLCGKTFVVLILRHQNTNFHQKFLSPLHPPASLANCQNASIVFAHLASFFLHLISGKLSMASTPLSHQKRLNK